MREYQLIIGRQASKEFEALPGEVIERVRQKVKALATTPQPHGSKKLRDTKRTWRIRVGDWRILYEINDDLGIVDIAAIRHRSRSYA